MCVIEKTLYNQFKPNPCLTPTISRTQWTSFLTCVYFLVYWFHLFIISKPHIYLYDSTATYPSVRYDDNNLEASNAVNRAILLEVRVFFWFIYFICSSSPSRISTHMTVQRPTLQCSPLRSCKSCRNRKKCFTNFPRQQRSKDFLLRERPTPHSPIHTLLVISDSKTTILQRT